MIHGGGASPKTGRAVITVPIATPLSYVADCEGGTVLADDLSS
jgi:hypothetical protein